MLRDGTLVPWSPKTHHLFPAAYRTAVLAVLCVANRHYDDGGVKGGLRTTIRHGSAWNASYAWGAEERGPAGRGRRNGGELVANGRWEGGEVRSVPLALLPELWRETLSYLGRDAFVQKPRPLLRCDVCGSGGKTKKCHACQVARYCSRECQKEAWKKHKKECKRIAKGRKKVVL